MAVSIPSGAYHAPLATSHDSVSINSFLAPSLWRASFPSFWRGQFWTMAFMWPTSFAEKYMPRGRRKMLPNSRHAWPTLGV